MGARLVELVLGGSREPWARVGLPYSSDDVCDVVSLALRIDSGREPGLQSWTWSGIDAGDIDGIPTDSAEPRMSSRVQAEDFTFDVIGVDHVVVMTCDLMRTSEALTLATGAALKRIRDVDATTQQAFHRVGDVVIELVSTPKVPKGPAQLWGFVLTVADLDSVADYLGPDVLSPPKPAVQEGRRIAKFRHAAGLGVPVALMD